MKAKLISEKLGFNREGKPLEKMGIGKKEELYLLKIQEFFKNIDVDMSYEKDDNQWNITFENEGSALLDKINDYSGILENGHFSVFDNYEDKVFNYEITSWQDLCRGIIEKNIEGGINQNILYLKNIEKNLEDIYK